MNYDLLNNNAVINSLTKISSISNEPEVQFSMARFFAPHFTVSKPYQRSNPEFAVSQPGKTHSTVGLLTKDTDAPKSKHCFYLTNLVMQGGGVLGIAHAGFVAGLEQAGIRFLGIAGTSAGAIMATSLLLGRGDHIAQMATPFATQTMSTMPMDKFVDGPFAVRKLIKHYAAKKSLFRPAHFKGLAQALTLLFRDRGLNLGDAFEHWLEVLMAQEGLETKADLDKRLEKIHQQASPLEQLEGLKFQENMGAFKLPEPSDLLQIMAASMPAGIKFQFPRDYELLSSEYHNASPALMVRASMSIPAFFKPYAKMVDQQNWSEKVEKSLAKLEHKNTLEDLKNREAVYFLDGGILSNFPSDAFESFRGRVPTIGVPLCSRERSAKKNSFLLRKTRSLMGDAGHLLNLVRRHRDIEAQSRQRELESKYSFTNQPAGMRIYPFRAHPIDTKDAEWLNFAMTNEEVVELFCIGVDQAGAFLKELTNEK